ncbi:2-C-methyl-D-erythritol 2,4-cyclodiphosphate synthase [Aliidiomarina shirensis]|uniref:2-C-methyl-D-erythritol 2,4-cyclodiphosphate synthase n=1 Tax=Aliidiomarina shirensis TaxID=1048642 RepID=A0A432WWW5_9GAMM|nr:2-C-methyl-D-erythritol 2,4-cyclodiphosphate synthase [Aliidiomarina shirensis]RUO38241.1 2-C-methyl-D-erythritol 2,4-cyclodiphosphate synthase [Aliidiomarina shirensis]
MRIGQGFDVHKFGGEGPVMLAGVPVDCDQGLLAHSDGDVVLHAICDALLGAIGQGDIGVWFPDTDAEFAGADSAKLLAKVWQAVKSAGYQLGNLDITIICQKPKINPHREAMRARVADILGVQQTSINIKATTTEGLGFTGRSEGIASMAAVLLVPINETNTK